MRINILNLFILCILTFPLFLTAQQIGVPFNQRDDSYRLLGLKRAKAAYEAARSNFEKKKELFEKQLISEQELVESENRYSDAEVNYQQSILAVLFESQYITITEAVKYQGTDGKKRVRIKLANSSGSAEFDHLINFEDELFRSLQPDVVHDVYVSLLNDDNAIISQPYEAKIEELHYRKPVEIIFGMLQDLDMVTVNLIYGNGTQRSPKIFLQKDATANKVIVQSQQFSQEVQLGGSASFDLTLELFSGQTNTYKLEVVNLPPQINHYFLDPQSKARLSQFKFTEQSNTRRAALEVYLPDRPSEQLKIDQPVTFYILIIPNDDLSLREKTRSRRWNVEEIKKLDIGYTKLELIPKGIGKLLVRAPQLYYQAEVGEKILVDLNLFNDGTRGLVNVDIDVDLPMNWKKEIHPAMIPSLEINQEETVEIALFPGKDTYPGKYEIRIKTYSLSDDQPVRGEEKTITVEILAETNLFVTLIIIMLILIIVGAIVILGIRITRR